MAFKFWAKYRNKKTLNWAQLYVFVGKWITKHWPFPLEANFGIIEPVNQVDIPKGEIDEPEGMFVVGYQSEPAQWLIRMKEYP